jgi:hypothetical protein
MAFIADEVFDSGLDNLSGLAPTARIDITVGEADDYTKATGTYNGTTQLSAGNETGMSPTGPTAGTPSGRAVTVPAITVGDVTATQTATHWALTDGASVLWATGTLTAGQAVTTGNTFTLDAITITLIDAVEV